MSTNIRVQRAIAVHKIVSTVLRNASRVFLKQKANLIRFTIYTGFNYDHVGKIQYDPLPSIISSESTKHLFFHFIE